MNPLLLPFATPFEVPPFDVIATDHYLPAFHEALSKGREDIAAIKSNPAQPDFENTIVALERSGELLGKISAIFFNLNSAETNEQIQKLAQEISPLLSTYGNDIALDAELYKKVNQIYEKPPADLTAEQKTLLDKTFKSFVRNGANLSEPDKQKLRSIDQQLSVASLQFGEHVLNETNEYKLVIATEKDLEGLPQSAIDAAANAAREGGMEGSWVITLHHPSYIPFMTYASNRALREELFKASGVKCFKADQQDNQQLVISISSLRDQRAKLLGYKSFAHFVLEERMAESPDKVFDFLNNLLAKAKPVAIAELASLEEFAEGVKAELPLQKWDIGFYSEQLKKVRFNIDDATLKPYFNLENVVEGIFTIASKLYGLHFFKRTDIPVYHPEVSVYEVTDSQQKHVAVLYTDFFPRKGKRSGAWMTSYRGQFRYQKREQRPHISIVCNFSKPTQSAPSLLTFNEVTTLFHEFGHALHGMLANQTYESLSGTNVFWDFVELPSQIMENWAYQKEALDLFARHYQTNEPLPIQLINKIKESKQFMAAYQAVRQVGLALLDLAWHCGPPGAGLRVDSYEKEVLSKTELLPVVEGTNTSCSYSHVFQGGYAAGYYSYKWAEVLEADAFELFEQEGIFNREVADRFKDHILSSGGSEHPMTLYKRFRGQEPSPEALLRRIGLAN